MKLKAEAPGLLLPLFLKVGKRSAGMLLFLG